MVSLAFHEGLQNWLLSLPVIIDNINKVNNFHSELELSADQIGGEKVPTLDTVVDMKVIQ